MQDSSLQGEDVDLDDLTRAGDGQVAVMCTHWVLAP